MREQTLNIRMIQHYMYCPRRFALLEINEDWAENAFVVKANLIHEHVHDGSHDYSDVRKVVRSAVAVYNDDPRYDLYGILDCVEFLKDDKGVEIPELNGKYRVRIVEYKPKSPKEGSFLETDAIQVFAQKLCADFVWKCNSEAYLYYSDNRRRVKLPFDEEYEKYNSGILKLLGEMRELLDTQEIPSRRKGQKCTGCSIMDLCFPKDKEYSIKDIVMSMEG